MTAKELFGNSEQLEEKDHVADIDKKVEAEDCISRRAAEEIVRFECGEWQGLASTIIKELDALPSEQRWIPWGSGKFPEESGTYTVTAYDGATKRVTYAKYQKRLKRWELTGARAYWRVLAFAPLPEPYRAAGGETDGEA